MNKTIAITAIVFVAVVMVIGAVSPVMANEGSNGCDKANPNAKACEKNPNADPCPGFPGETPPCPDTR